MSKQVHPVVVIGVIAIAIAAAGFFIYSHSGFTPPQINATTAKTPDEVIKKFETNPGALSYQERQMWKSLPAAKKNEAVAQAKKNGVAL